jgi:hypothetical protein
VVGIATMTVTVILLLPFLRALPATLAPAFDHWSIGFKGWGTALTALVAASAALFGTYAEKRGFSANAKRYDRMFAVFDRGLHRLRHASGAEETAQILHDLGREALVEHGDWLLARRDRPLRVVSRG